MFLALNLHALFDPSADYTKLRACVHQSRGSSFSVAPIVYFERDLEIVWGDRHSIQVRNAMRAAVEAFTAREVELRGLPCA